MVPSQLTSEALLSVSPLLPPLFPISPLISRCHAVRTGRLDQFESRISEVLFEHRLDDKEHVQLELWSCPGKEKVRISLSTAIQVYGVCSCDAKLCCTDTL